MAGVSVDDTDEFTTTLRASIQRSGLSLGTIRRRLRERGFDISVSALSMWRSGTRRPEKDTSLDVIRELETMLDLDPGTLVIAIGRKQRIREALPHRTYASLLELSTSDMTNEPIPELLERSGSLSVRVNATSQIISSVNRTLWQAARDRARDATVFYGWPAPELGAIHIKGAIGCELVDIKEVPDQEFMRATLRLASPMRRGELILTERCSQRRNGPPRYEITVVVPRRQAEIVVHAQFDPTAVPRRCGAVVERDADVVTFPVALNGCEATHAEFGFGPGLITLYWDW